jgi:hypothetical protein
VVCEEEFVKFWTREISEGRQVAEEVAGLCAQMARDLRMQVISDRQVEEEAGGAAVESPTRVAAEVPFTAIVGQGWVPPEGRG